VALEALNHGVYQRDAGGHECAEQQYGEQNDYPLDVDYGENGLVGDVQALGESVYAGLFGGGEQGVPFPQHQTADGQSAAVHNAAQYCGALDALLVQLGGCGDHGGDGDALEGGIDNYALPYGQRRGIGVRSHGSDIVFGHQFLRDGGEIGGQAGDYHDCGDYQDGDG